MTEQNGRNGNGWLMKIILGSIIASGVAGLFASSGWAVLQIMALGQNQGRILEQLSSGTADRYRAIDAAKDFALRDQALANLAREVTDLKGCR